MTHVLTEYGPVRKTFEKPSYSYEPGTPCEVLGVDPLNPQKLVVRIERDGFVMTRSVPAEHVALVQ